MNGCPSKRYKKAEVFTDSVRYSLPLEYRVSLNCGAKLRLLAELSFLARIKVYFHNLI